MAVDLNTNYDSLVESWEEVRNEKSINNWSLYGYDGKSYVLKVIEKGDGGIEEMVNYLCNGKIMYALCRLIDPKSSLPKLVFINWQGEGAPPTKKGICTNHLRAITDLFKGIHLTITARNDDDIEPEVIMKTLEKASSSYYSFKERSTELNDMKPVGTTYQKIIPSKEINQDKRTKFWSEHEKEFSNYKNENKSKNVILNGGTVSKIQNFAKKIDAKVNEHIYSQKNTQFDLLNNTKNDSLSEITVYTQENIPESTSYTEISNELTEYDLPYMQQSDFQNDSEIMQQGLCARALYDYSAADDTEISFDPDDIICNINQIDEGWWYGMDIHGKFGLFPSNYVQLLARSSSHEVTN